MEPQTVANYPATRVDPDGVRAEVIKKSLEGDIQEALNHPTQIANPIKQFGWTRSRPPSLEFSNFHLTETDASTDVGKVNGHFSPAG